MKISPAGDLSAYDRIPDDTECHTWIDGGIGVSVENGILSKWQINLGSTGRIGVYFFKGMECYKPKRLSPSDIFVWPDGFQCNRDEFDEGIVLNKSDDYKIIYENPPSPEPSGIEALVCADITARQQMGIKKYGTTVDKNPLTKPQWLQHAYEEALDLAIYLKKCIKEFGGN